jgi:hypothetical protein
MEAAELAAVVVLDRPLMTLAALAAAHVAPFFHRAAGP